MVVSLHRPLPQARVLEAPARGSRLPLVAPAHGSRSWLPLVAPACSSSSLLQLVASAPAPAQLVAPGPTRASRSSSARGSSSSPWLQAVAHGSSSCLGLQVLAVLAHGSRSYSWLRAPTPAHSSNSRWHLPSSSSWLQLQLVALGCSRFRLIGHNKSYEEL